MKKKIKIITWITIPLILLVLYYWYCTPHKLNEKVFYEDENIQLKVTRYYEFLLFHYNGPTNVIGCKSKDTKLRRDKRLGRGWKRLAKPNELVGLGWDPPLNILVDIAKESIHVTDVGTIIYSTGSSIEVTWNSCNFARWNPNKKMPEELVSNEGYQKCLEDSKEKVKTMGFPENWGEKNCKPYRFFGDNRPTFFELNASHSGFASFKVKSEAFLEAETYIVETHDYGKSWSFNEV